MRATYIRPEIGQIYSLKNGGEYRCIQVSDVDRVEQGECSAVLVRDKDGWTLTAHGLQKNANGKVEWDYSTGGHWSDEKKPGRFEVWKDSELGHSYKEKSFESPVDAAEWIEKNERFYPGWHLRIAEA